MAERPNLVGVGPILPVPDVAAAAKFYCEKLGFELDFIMGEPADHGSVVRCSVGIQFTLAEDVARGAYPGWFYFFVENIDALAAEYAGRGVTFAKPLKDHDHGMREFEVEDLNGYRLRFGQYL